VTFTTCSSGYEDKNWSQRLVRFGVGRRPGYNGRVPNPSTAEVRQWARARGYAVGDRGRLSPNLVAAYLADQPGAPAGPRPADAERRKAAAVAPKPRDGGRTTQPGQRVVRAKTPWNWPQLQQDGRPDRRGSRARG
jgi:hypothetical protein